MCIYKAVHYFFFTYFTYKFVSMAEFLATKKLLTDELLTDEEFLAKQKSLTEQKFLTEFVPKPENSKKRQRPCNDSESDSGDESEVFFEPTKKFWCRNCGTRETVSCSDYGHNTKKNCRQCRSIFLSRQCSFCRSMSEKSLWGLVRAKPLVQPKQPVEHIWSAMTNNPHKIFTYGGQTNKDSADETDLTSPEKSPEGHRKPLNVWTEPVSDSSNETYEETEETENLENSETTDEPSYEDAHEACLDRCFSDLEYFTTHGHFRPSVFDDFPQW